jgi:hypothetical protein
MKLDNNLDLRIEEYKALRVEIMHQLDAIEKNVIACITTTPIALTYGLKESQPFVIFLACAIPMYFWLKHIDHRNTIAKAAAYIRTFLEGSETNLMWESRTRSENLKYQGSRFTYWSVTFLLPYPVLVIVSIVTTFWSLRHTYFSLLPSWLMILVSLVVVFIVLMVAKKADKSYMALLKPWNEAFEDFKLLEKCLLLNKLSPPAKRIRSRKGRLRVS